MLTKTQVKVILILLDNEGHAGWEIARILEMEDSNLNPILQELKEMKIVRRGRIRVSRNQLAKKPGQHLEYPYYLSNKLNELKIIIREIVKTNKVYDAGFVLGIMRKSKYLEFMQERFKSDLRKNMMDELRNSYPPFKDPFFINVIEPSIG
jgi:predicted transcriptional regulator